MKYMTNILRVVNGVFTHAIRSLYPGVPELKATVQYSGSKFGDYKCMAAMPIAQVCTCKQLILSPRFLCENTPYCNCQMLKSQGCVVSPRDIAQEIVSGLQFSDPFIHKVHFCKCSKSIICNVESTLYLCIGSALDGGMCSRSSCSTLLCILCYCSVKWPVLGSSTYPCNLVMCLVWYRDCWLEE